MKKRTRLILFLLAVLASIFFLIPTIKWYFLFNENDRNEARIQGDKLKEVISNKVDATTKDLEAGKNYPDILKKLNTNFKNELDIYNTVNFKNKIKIKSNYTYQEIKNELTNLKGKEKLAQNFMRSQIEDYYKSYYKEKVNVKNGIIKLGLDLQGGVYVVVSVKFDDPKLKKEYPNGIPKTEKDAMIDSAVLKIENRINKYGVAETQIQKLKDQEKIIINLPGVKEATELRQIIETVGVLEFKYVSSDGTTALNEIIAEAQKEGKPFLDNKGKLLPEYQQKLNAKIPDVEALIQSERDTYGIEKEQRRMVAVEKESLLGKNMKILTAYVSQNNLAQNVVDFELDSEDAKKWAVVTEQAAKDQRRIAIILDDVVLQDPVVREKIPNGKSQITLGDSPIEELRTLALVLRSGSMNVPLEISEENTVGASMGKDTIKYGQNAMLYGILIVFLFMFIWYSAGGLIADLLMILNLLFLFGGLAMFHGTLTLPGLAGIILTIGMAVDANVIIYERIKEEYRTGKTFKTSLVLGFDRAFWTIFDSNLTTFISGIGLTMFGPGAIKGFAVTLCFGLVTSVFSALYGSRLVYDFLTSYIDFKSIRTLSWIRGK